MSKILAVRLEGLSIKGQVIIEEGVDESRVLTMAEKTLRSLVNNGMSDIQLRDHIAAKSGRAIVLPGKPPSFIPFDTISI